MAGQAVLPRLVVLLVFLAGSHKQLRSLASAEDAVCAPDSVLLEEELDDEEMSALQLSSEVQLQPQESSIYHYGSGAPFKMVGCCFVAALGYVLFREIRFIHAGCCSQGLLPRHRRRMILLEAALTVVGSVDYAVIIPIAYSLSKALDSGYLMAGFAVSSFSIGVALGANMGCKVMVFLPQTIKRRYLVINAAFLATCQVLLAYVMSSTGLHDKQALVWLIIVVRIVAGFVAGCTSVYQMMLEYVCTQREFATIENLQSPCEFLGLTIGSIITALTCGIPKDATTFQSCAHPLMVLATIWALMSVAISWITPLNLDEVKYTQEPQTLVPPVIQARSQSSDVLYESPDVLSEGARATVTIHAVVQVVVCSSSTVAIEIATAFVMQVQYSWSPSDIGYGTGAVYAIAVVVSCTICLVRVHAGTHVDKIIGIVLSIASVVGSLLLTNSANSFRMLLGNLLIYPSMTACTGMLVGYSIFFADERKWHSTDNVVSTLYGLASCFKLCMAPFVTWLLAAYGRKTYAAFQVMLAFASLLNFALARYITMHRRVGRTKASCFRGETKAFKSDKVDQLRGPLDAPEIRDLYKDTMYR